MFRNVVSNLSLSPAATSQLTFYWRRLQGEQLTRKLSMVTAAALVLVQLATVVAPPDAATASSSNDIIQGGYSSKGMLVHIYDTNAEVRALYNHYGVDRADIESSRSAHGGELTSSDHTIQSLGRNPHSTLDQRVVVGGHTYYIRPLYSWGDGINYSGLVGHRHGDGGYFAILEHCGNIAVRSTPKPAPAPKPTPTPTPVPAPVARPAVKPTAAPVPVVSPITAPVAAPGSPNIVLSKSAVLVSAADGSQKDANQATAQAGDTIEYTLTTKNTGTAAAKDYVVSENLNDVLEYADVIDPRGGVLVGGALNWPQATIAAGSSYISTFQVRVKNPLPTAPTSISDPQSYDLRMDNVYGNLVSVNLAVPAQKQLEVASATLPQTGAATDTLIVLLLVGGIAYFYFRNRQLITEIGILRGDHHGGVK